MTMRGMTAEERAFRKRWRLADDDPGPVLLPSPMFEEDHARNLEAERDGITNFGSDPVSGQAGDNVLGGGSGNDRLATSVSQDSRDGEIVVTGHTPRQIIASGGKLGRIAIADNPTAKSDAPWYEFPGFQEVTQNERHISESAAKYGVDPDLLRSIIWIETTHGWYDRIKQPFDANASIRPMNVNTDYWGDTWGNRKALKDPANNIAAGARMIKSITAAMPGAPIASRASVYNYDRADKVSDYGKRVQKIYAQKPWRNWKPAAATPWFIPPRR